MRSNSKEARGRPGIFARDPGRLWMRRDGSPEGMPARDMELYEQLISDGIAADRRGSAIDHVTARRTAIWLMSRRQQPDFVGGLLHFARTGAFTQNLKTQLDATTASIAITNHAVDREAHTREVRQYGQKLPENSHSRRARRPSPPGTLESPNASALSNAPTKPPSTTPRHQRRNLRDDPRQRAPVRLGTGNRIGGVNRRSLRAASLAQRTTTILSSRSMSKVADCRARSHPSCEVRNADTRRKR